MSPLSLGVPKVRRASNERSELRFVIRDLQNEKREHLHLPHSPPSEVEGVRMIVILFRNIAKNDTYLEIQYVELILLS